MPALVAGKALKKKQAVEKSFGRGNQKMTRSFMW